MTLKATLRDTPRAHLHDAEAPPTSLSVEGWIGIPRSERGALPAASVLVTLPGGATLGLLPCRRLFLYRRGWSAPLVGRTPLKTGAWFHVGLTMIPEGSALYLNGIQDARVVGEPSASRYVYDEQRAQLFDGEVFNLRFWNEAKTPGQMFRRAWDLEEKPLHRPAPTAAATFFSRLPDAASRWLGRTDNPPRLPLAV